MLRTCAAATAPDRRRDVHGRLSNVASRSRAPPYIPLPEASSSQSSAPQPLRVHLAMLPVKRQKLSEDDSSHAPSDEEMLSGPEQEQFSDADSGSDSGEPDTEDEIAEGSLAKSKKTAKRKRRATDAVNFGATLQSLLTTNAPAAPLSLKPSLAKKRKDEKLEAKGKQVLQVERKEKEDRGHITDVIGGWGGESERALRKVAQRGGMFDSFACFESTEAQSTSSREAL